MKPLRLVLAALAVVVAIGLSLGAVTGGTAATAGTVAAAGTNIGNAGVLTSSNTGAGNLGSMSEDWWVFYLPTPGAAPNVQIINTSAPGLCAITAALYGTEGTNQRISANNILIPGNAGAITDPLTGFASDRYFVEVQLSTCGSSATDATTAPYTINVAGATGTPPSLVAGQVAAGTSDANAWPPLQGQAYYTGTLGGAAWYLLYKKQDAAAATIRIQDTTLFTNSSTVCPDFTADLYDYTSSLREVSSTDMYGNEAATLTIPGSVSGDQQGRYYLELTPSGCDRPNTTTYSIEPEPGAQWGRQSQALPVGPRRTAAAGPLAGGLNYSDSPGAAAADWSYFQASAAAVVRAQNISGAGCALRLLIDNASGTKVASASLAAGAVSGLQVGKAGTYYLSVAVTAGCKPATPVTALLQLSGSVRGPVLRVTNPALKAGVIKKAYSSALTVTGGRKVYTFAALTALPPGLRLNVKTGAITGKPTRAGAYTFMVRVTDSAKPTHNTATAAIRLTVT
jgi:hypothetical protein